MKTRTIQCALVTGASGFIGTHLVQRLCEMGVRVYATDRFAPIAAPPVEAFFQEDLVTGQDWPKVLEEVDTIFHMAAIASIAREDPREYERVNVDGSRRIAELAMSGGVEKILHMSSSTVYGTPEQCPLSEAAPLFPKNPYSQSKEQAERAICAGGENGVPCTIIRPRVVVGAGRAGIFALVFEFISRNAPIPLIGGGANRFQFTAVSDLIDACILGAQEKTKSHQIYNIGSDVTRTLREDLEELIHRVGSRSRILSVPTGPIQWGLGWLHRAGISPLVPEQFQIANADFVLSTTRAKERLGFAPQFENMDGIVEAWQWWTENRSSVGGFRNLRRIIQPKYQNALQKRDK